jgi:hypothetical protein
LDQGDKLLAKVDPVRRGPLEIGAHGDPSGCAFETPLRAPQAFESRRKNTFRNSHVLTYRPESASF